MKYKVDLHTHTTASDGQYAPDQLVEMAQKAGIQYLAVTDHDTMDGVEAAIEAGKKQGVHVLRGVELGAREDRNLHILGLGLQPGPTPLGELCETLRKSRDERKYRILSFLKEKGVEISLEEVETMAGGKVVARPHFARVMVQRGYVATTREAFDRYLDTDEYQRIERFKAGAAQCIEAIHQAGGKAVFAHPYQLRYEAEQLEAMVRSLKEYGIDGMECYYPKHTPKMVEQYLQLAEKYGLYVTAGSDFHGEQVHPDMPLTPVSLEIEWILQ